jgi:hypothetical protein
MNHQFDSIPSGFFTYFPNTKRFVAERSDLYDFDILQTAYENQSVMGFAMKSSRTGRIVPFYYVGKLQEMEEYDGELLGWKFVCGHDDNPNGEHYECLILND